MHNPLALLAPSPTPTMTTPLPNLTQYMQTTADLYAHLAHAEDQVSMMHPAVRWFGARRLARLRRQVDAAHAHRLALYNIIKQLHETDKDQP